MTGSAVVQSTLPLVTDLCSGLHLPGSVARNGHELHGMVWHTYSSHHDDNV
jgi:hypothetical protein